MMIDFEPRRSQTTAPPQWDDIHTATLLPLVGVRTMSTEFGFLLRHYWMPATRLEYGTTLSLNDRNNGNEQYNRKLTKQMVRCDADRCLWRQSVRPWNTTDREPIRFLSRQEEEWICEYDRSRQTLRTKPVTAFDFHERTENEAFRTAFLQLPILTPLLPVPIGFQWHVKSVDGHIDFCLESFEQINGMSVLFIRRKGVLTVDRYYRDDTEWIKPCRIEREGVTAYALERSVVLEDRTRDIVQAEATGPVEVRTTTKLLSSTACAKPAPFYEKYRTKDGKRYLYDGVSGHIIEVDETVYSLVDDWRILTDEEMVDKYRTHTDETVVRKVLTELGGLSGNGVLIDCEPRELSRVECVFCHRQETEVGEFWKRNAILLVLGITERCNLCCEYCCYSGKFAGQRTHSSRSMSREIAEKAISEFLKNDQAGDGNSPIAFYGGEPLLELELLKDCVRMAETQGRQLGRTVRFALTTNGTLLDDATVDYLVEHRFLVMVSLDGPQTSHDRYRVFPDQRGSFDIVSRNLRRFAERYPDYRQRGLSMTLAPPLDIDEIDRFIKEWFPAYPLTRASLVNTGSEHRFPDAPAPALLYGCASKPACKNGSGDAFLNFDERDRDAFNRLWRSCMEHIAAHGTQRTWEIMPLAMMLFEGQISRYHRRMVTENAPEWVFLIPCMPGMSRRFCDVDGNYRVCERTDASDAFVVGDVWNGLDVRKFQRIMELRRHFGDCGNCIAQKVCDICYARIPESDAAASGYDPQFDLQCQQTRQMTIRLLTTYTAGL